MAKHDIICDTCKKPVQVSLRRITTCRNCSYSLRADRLRGKNTYDDLSLFGRHRHMMDRCYDKSNVAYHNYGGRGISVCDEWHDRDTFVLWAKNSGYKRELTLDRLDNDGNYGPTNCRFTDRTVQANNRRPRRTNAQLKLDKERI